MQFSIILREIKKKPDISMDGLKQYRHSNIVCYIGQINLQVLNIQVVGVMLFSAPISEKVQLYVIRGNFILKKFLDLLFRLITYSSIFFVLNITKLNIFSSLQKLVVNYDIIPFLILLISSIVLVNKYFQEHIMQQKNIVSPIVLSIRKII